MDILRLIMIYPIQASLEPEEEIIVMIGMVPRIGVLLELLSRVTLLRRWAILRQRLTTKITDQLPEMLPPSYCLFS